MQTPYGHRVNRFGHEARSVVGDVEVSPAGNVVLRVGRENAPEQGGWHQTEHVVLLPVEARALAERLAELGDES